MISRGRGNPIIDSSFPSLHEEFRGAQTILRDLKGRLERERRRKIPYLRVRCTFRKNQRLPWPHREEEREEEKWKIIGGVARLTAKAKAKEKRGEVVVGENRSCNIRDGKSNSFVRSPGEKGRGRKKDRSYTRRTIKDERKDVTSAFTAEPRQDGR